MHLILYVMNRLIWVSQWFPNTCQPSTSPNGNFQRTVKKVRLHLGYLFWGLTHPKFWAIGLTHQLNPFFTDLLLIFFGSRLTSKSILNHIIFFIELCYLNYHLDDNFCDNHKFTKKTRYWPKNQSNWKESKNIMWV